MTALVPSRTPNSVPPRLGEFTEACRDVNWPWRFVTAVIVADERSVGFAIRRPKFERRVASEVA
jgi:hypothetical protein